MVTLDGYTVMQKKNEICIFLPQTMETMTSTVAPVTGRKLWLSDTEKSVLLWIVKKMMEVEQDEQQTEKTSTNQENMQKMRNQTCKQTRSRRSLHEVWME